MIPHRNTMIQNLPLQIPLTCEINHSSPTVSQRPLIVFALMAVSAQMIDESSREFHSELPPLQSLVTDFY